MPEGTGQEGPYRGTTYANVPPLIGNLCSKPEGGVDVAMYKALMYELTLEEALDLWEIDEVGRSWRAAIEGNIRKASEAARRKKGGR